MSRIAVKRSSLVVAAKFRGRSDNARPADCVRFKLAQSLDIWLYSSTVRQCPMETNKMCAVAKIRFFLSSFFRLPRYTSTSRDVSTVNLLARKAVPYVDFAIERRIHIWRGSFVYVCMLRHFKKDIYSHRAIIQAAAFNIKYLFAALLVT